jgi:hypothetical protein
MKLTIALATRGRPPLLAQTLNRTLACIEDPNTRLVVLVDEDDHPTNGLTVRDDRVVVSIAPREDSLGGKYNRALRIAPAEVYMTMVDYAPHVTPGFDKRIVEAAELFPDGIGVIYNHMANLSFPSLNAVTARWAELTGGIYPEIFPYWFVDHWLDDLARMTDRIACAEVSADVAMRPGTQEQREPAFWAMVFDTLAIERRQVALSVIHEMDEPAWRKDVLRSRLHLVEERSRMVNTFVRRMPGADESTDERYQRIRERAMDRLRKVAGELQAA